LHLLSTPDDKAVAGGVAIMIGYGVAAAYLGRWTFRRLKVKIESRDAHRIGLVFAVFAVAASAMLTSGCNKVIPPGHVGIKVNQSGSDRGVQDFPLQTGRVFYNPFTEDVLNYPTFVQRVIWTKDALEGKPVNEEINYNSKDELVFTGDFTVSYELTAAQVPKFYVRFRNDDIGAFTHGFFRDQVRDALNEVAVQYTADELYGEKKSEFLDKAKARVISRVEPFGVNVIALGYAASPRPPEAVATAINLKIAAIQKASQTENELRQASAEAKKTIATAEGTAKANAVISQSINAQLVLWRQLDVQQQAIGKWNGQLPTYNGGGAIPFIQVQK
jgi:regulator of protease activity HflC (stomatin/prohibitin superfamily)